jgi:hypothetical protein
VEDAGAGVGVNTWVGVAEAGGAGAGAGAEVGAGAFIEAGSGAFTEADAGAFIEAGSGASTEAGAGAVVGAGAEACIEVVVDASAEAVAGASVEGVVDASVEALPGVSTGSFDGISPWSIGTGAKGTGVPAKPDEGALVGANTGGPARGSASDEPSAGAAIGASIAKVCASPALHISTVVPAPTGAHPPTPRALIKPSGAKRQLAKMGGQWSSSTRDADADAATIRELRDRLDRMVEATRAGNIQANKRRDDAHAASVRARADREREVVAGGTAVACFLVAYRYRRGAAERAERAAYTVARGVRRALRRPFKN